MNRAKERRTAAIHSPAAVIEASERPSEPPLAELSTRDGDGILFSLARIVEQRDSHTAGHCDRLAFTAVALGVAMALDSSSLLTLYLGGYLHDVGKVGIPDSILFKPGALTEEEWEVMRSHPVRGEEICRPLKSFRHVLPLIRSHHERMDGTGYPDRLSGDQFPILARVLQTVDIYDALTNPRPYKGAYGRSKALEIMEEESDRGWRDREITELFVRLNKRVLEKAQVQNMAPARSMQDSMANLRAFLAQ
jgi:putative two-component system response regulator